MKCSKKTSILQRFEFRATTTQQMIFFPDKNKISTSSTGMLATHLRYDKNTIRYGGSTALQTVFTAYARAPAVRMMSKEHFLLMSVLDFVLTFLAP